MKRYSLELVAFLSGAAVMILELVGSRVLAPHLGISLSVWTALIGIILGSLSIGYWWGGKLADRGAHPRTLAILLFLAGLFVGGMALTKEFVLLLLGELTPRIGLGSVLAALSLFAAPSVLLGMITPYTVKLKLQTLAASGRTVGNLYALSTIGSIAGTFAAGFFLIPAFGTTKILFVLAVGLIALSLLPLTGKGHMKRIGTLALFLLLFIIFQNVERLLAARGFIDLDSRYNRIQIWETIDLATGRPIRELLTDGKGIQSAMFTDRDDDLVFPYTKFYRLVAHFVPEIRNGLLIGAGAYSYPKDYLKRFPEAALEVVELDPKITEVAKQYFNLPDDPRLTIVHEDGRSFLNRRAGRYDAIFMDAFKSYSPPFELTTQETVKALFRHLSERGAVLVNLISSIEGPKGKFLRAEYLTYASVFPQVYLFPVSYPDRPELPQNIMLLALKSSEPLAFKSVDPELDAYLAHRWEAPVTEDVPLLTDDHAPVEFYLRDIF